MPNLPTGDYNWFAGIDPGQKGAVGLIDNGGQIVRVWDMPLTKAARDRQKEIDLDALRSIYHELERRQRLVLGIEQPNTRPGEGAERSFRFGKGLGYLHAFAHLLQLDYYLMVPNLWKGRLGLPGKSDPNANKLGAQMLDRNYPAAHDLIRGPRGGLKDGRIDALLIAHFLRRRTVGGMRTIVEQYGKDSPQVAELVFGRSRKNVMRTS